MQFQITSLCATLIACVSCASAGTTQTFSPTGTSGDFDVASNWSPSGVPGEDDRIVIPSGKTCLLDTTEEIDSFSVDGIISIQAGGLLKVDHDNGPAGNNEIDGKINLASSTSELSFIDTNQRVSGTGDISGANDSAKISIENGNKLTIKDDAFKIYGRLEINATSNTGSNAILRNEARIYAFSQTTQGTLTLGSKLDLEDTVLADWRATDIDGTTSNTGITLKFLTEATGLAGRFIIDETGEMEFHVDVTTTGPFTCTDGSVDIEAGATFTYGSPSSSITADCDCGTSPCP